MFLPKGWLILTPYRDYTQMLVTDVLLSTKKVVKGKYLKENIQTCFVKRFSGILLGNFFSRLFFVFKYVPYDTFPREIIPK